MRRIMLVLFVLAVASFSCKPRGSRVRLEPTSFMPKLAERITRVLSEPAVSSSFDALIDAVASDPTVRDRGESLLGNIAADPGTAQAISQLMAQLQESPELK